MTLTQQFLLVSILPLSFLGMAVYLWFSGPTRRSLLARWSLTLVAATIWASSILRFYGGVTFPNWLVFTWSVIGNYAFSLAAIGVLLATVSHLVTPSGHSRIAIVLSLLLWLAALGLDPYIWSFEIPNFVLADQTIRHFDVWAAVWITSWMLPIMAAWILTQQVNAGLPNSLYRNQVHYWLLMLTLFFIGGGLASIQQPGEPGWQEAGVLLIVLATLTGTVSIGRSQLPDLQLAFRQILSRLSGTLIVFGLTWFALTFIVQRVTNLPPDTDEELILFLAAAVFAALFTLIYRLVNRLTHRLFLPTLARQDAAVSNYANAIGNLPDPAQLGQLFLRILQSTLAVDDAAFFTTEDGPGGKLVLRPLASLDESEAETIDFEGDSPFARYLRQNPTPLVQYDIDVLSTFDEMSASEKAFLSQWQRVLYLPLHAGESLVGVVAMGAKYSGELYDRRDFDLLRSLAEQISPLLAQANNLASLRRINDYVFEQNQTLVRQKQHLEELTNLYDQFVGLISPELRRPFASITQQIHQLQEELAENNSKQLLGKLGQQVEALKTPIDNLITMSGRIQVRKEFDFKPIHLDEVSQSAIRQLKAMAEARRVRVELKSDVPVPAVYGDEQQMQEAIQHLLHNAIKFNKIGGLVRLDLGISGSEIYLRVVDTGVGIPEERLATVWDGFTSLNHNGSSRGGGLGLALTRFIIAAHGGHVEAESKHGSGSVFTIYLPLVYENNNDDA